MPAVTRASSQQPDPDDDDETGDSTLRQIQQPTATRPNPDEDQESDENQGYENQMGEVIEAIRGMTRRLDRMETTFDGRMKNVETGIEGLYGAHNTTAKRLETIEGGHVSAGATAAAPGGLLRGNKRGIIDISGGVDEDGRLPQLPARGQFGEYPSLDVRYGHLDAKVRDAALACHLTPLQLHLLIPSTSRFHQGTDDGSDIRLVADENGTFTFKNTAKTDTKTTVSKFAANIPGPLAFLCAWTHYTGLVAHGLGANTPEDIQLVWVSMMWYADHIVWLAGSHTWESVCRYHVSFQNQRCQQSFHASLWYQAVDQDKLGLLEPKARTAATTSSKASSSRGGLHRAPAREKRDVSGEACHQWNFWRCTEPCKNGRRHHCSICSGPHKQADCKGKMKA